MPRFLVISVIGLAWVAAWLGGCPSPQVPVEGSSETRVEAGLAEGAEASKDATADLAPNAERAVEAFEETSDRQGGETSEPPREVATDAIPCEPACPVPPSRCLGDSEIQHCAVEGGCAVWKAGEVCKAGEICKAGGCLPKPCDGLGQCGADRVCLDGLCQSRSLCCSPKASRCIGGAEEICTAGPEECGRWGSPTLCPAKTSCHKDRCEACHHRPCALAKDCCKGSTCTYGYCLTECDPLQGEIDNPACQTNDFCFSLSPRAPALCYPDGQEPKGAPCSIIQVCGFDLSCVDIGKGFTCYSDCDPLQGSAGHPACDPQEQCVRVIGSNLGGICVPLVAPPAKRYEACSSSIPCTSPDRCVGEPGTSTSFCLPSCDPTVQPPSCPAGSLCAAYHPLDPSQGVCLQICQNPGGKDSCLYGECRSKGPQNLCL